MTHTFDPGAEQRTRLALQRNLLAAERTFLSWVRTGIACIGGGIAFERLLAFQTQAHQKTAFYVGVLLILLGMGIFLGALVEYEKAFKQFKSWDPGMHVSMGWRRSVIMVLLILSLLFLYLI